MEEQNTQTDQSVSAAAMPAPGDCLRLTITDVAFGGDGVGRIGNLVVFVPFVIPGERVDAEVVEVKKSYVRARMVALIEPSPHRVAPRCPYFGDCGGCQYQHLAYSEQLKVKHKQVSDLFERIGGRSGLRVHPVIPCPEQFGYRNRIMVRSQWNRDRQALNIGYLRHDNRLVVDVEHCPIAEPVLNEELRTVRQNPPPKGGIKVALRKYPEGWQVPPDSFFQNNFILLPELVNTVRGYLKASGVRYLIDAYCGVGFFGVELAGDVDMFVGVELDRRAIAAAKENARTRSISNGDFLNGSVEEFLPELLKRFPPEQTAVVIDPPRKGCHPGILETLRRSGLAQVVYVSCNPATLARDLQGLAEDGAYQAESITPLDMFPQTQHVECVANLRRAIAD